MRKLMILPLITAVLGAAYYLTTHAYELYYQYGASGLLFLTWLVSLVAAVIYFDPRD